jgi:hypothetical protein
MASFLKCVQPEVPLKNYEHFFGCSFGKAVPDLPCGNTGNGIPFQKVHMERPFPNGIHEMACVRREKKVVDLSLLEV